MPLCFDRRQIYLPDDVIANGVQQLVVIAGLVTVRSKVRKVALAGTFTANELKGGTVRSRAASFHGIYRLLTAELTPDATYCAPETAMLLSVLTVFVASCSTTLAALTSSLLTTTAPSAAYL